MRSYEELRDSLNWDAVRAKAEEIKLPFESDHADVMAAALRALKKWGPADSEAEIVAIEQRDHFSIFDFERKEGESDDEAPGAEWEQEIVVDLILRRPGGELEVVDWKSTRSLDADWVFDKRASRQWMLYCEAWKAKKAVFRGIQPDGRCRELALEWPFGKFDKRQLVGEVAALHQARAALWGFDRWPRHGAGRSGCRAFGRECPFLKQGCLEDGSPRGLLPPQHFSFSGMQTFKLCPERYRAQRVACLKEESVRADWGSAFHAAMAEIYGQMRGMQ